MNRARTARLSLILIPLTAVAVTGGTGPTPAASARHAGKGPASHRESAVASLAGDPGLTITPLAPSVPSTDSGLASLQPTALASADFDKDGVPDLAAAYAGGATGGSVILRGGRRGSLFASTPEAIEKSKPFTADGLPFDVLLTPDFLAAGDADNDGHFDIVVGERGADVLLFLAGDGTGGFAPAEALRLPGPLEAMAAGEVNRADGLIDLAAAVRTPRGARLLVFESPGGLLKAIPEQIILPDEGIAVGLGDLDGDFISDIAIATRSSLVVVTGRDRRLASGPGERANVSPPSVATIPLSSPAVAMVVGRILPEDTMGIALLGEDGVLRVAPGRHPGAFGEIDGDFAGATGLAAGHILGGSSDDLIVIEKGARRLRIVRAGVRAARMTEVDLDGEPAAVLPMRMDGDTRQDLALLLDGGAAPLAMTHASILAVHQVTNTSDSGPGSLRQAILDANGTPGANTISFNIPGSGPFTIQPLFTLPAITGFTTVDGTTQPGYSGTPLIELDGTTVMGDGLVLQDGDNVVRGLAVNRFQGNGILIDGAGHNLVEGCYIGIDLSGTVDAGNALSGILIRNSHLNTIGGTTLAARNVVSGNDQRGISIESSGASAIDFFSDPPGVTICDLCTVSLPLNVPFEGGLTDVNVNLTLTHTYDADLQLTLIAPDGTRVILSEFNGGSGDDYLGTTFDDEGPTPITAGSPPFSGVFIPMEPLSGLDGKNCGGTWRLEVRDFASGDTGFFSSWSIAFSSVRGFGNVIEGNLIGTQASGTAALGNTKNVVIEGSPANLVGGSTSGARNVISGGSEQASGAGVEIIGVDAPLNRIEGNYIGTDITGTAAFPNVHAGVLLSGARDCIVGGTAMGAGNLISGNGRYGVRAEASEFCDIRGNWIGTTASGAAALANSGAQACGAGASIYQGVANTVGGTVAGAGNVISGNDHSEFWCQSTGLEILSLASTAYGNYIGTDITGLQAVPNGVGALIQAQGTLFGGAGPGEGNLVSGNLSDGVIVSGSGVVVAGNIIGLDRTGTSRLGNGFFGVRLSNTSSVTVGGTAAGAANTIAASRYYGIFVSDSLLAQQTTLASSDTPKVIPDLSTITSSVTTAVDEQIQWIAVTVSISHTWDSDLILTLIAPDGTRFLLANRRGGSGDDYAGTQFYDPDGFSTPISAGAPPFNGAFAAEDPLGFFVGRRSVGTWTLEVMDVASGDTGVLWGWSLLLDTAPPHDNRIIGNYIGTNASGAANLGNGDAGIRTHFGAYGLQIGGASPGEGNVISGNGSDGVQMIAGGRYDFVSVQGNLIGVKPDGITPLGNAGSGVSVVGGSYLIGGPGPAYGNLIAHNASAGVLVHEPSPTTLPRQTTIQGNSIHDNGGLGIDLDPNGVTLNDSGDVDDGANLRQNFPVVTGAVPMSGGTLLSGTVSSAANAKLTIDVYGNVAGDPTGYGEGRNWLGSQMLVTNGAGLATWAIFTPATGVLFPAATATDFAGNTSEFSGGFSQPQEASAAQDMTLEPAGGSSVTMTYTPACGATNHAIYWGVAGPLTIPGVLNFTNVECSVGTSGTATFDPGTPPQGKVYYFVIVGQNAMQEGSYGQDFFGGERPEASLVSSCDRPLAVGGVCP